jgi:AraC family transcriptional regulator
MENLDHPFGIASMRFRPSVATYPPDATFGPRTLDDFEFVWVTAGSAEWTWIEGGDGVELEPGMLLLTRPGMTDEFCWGKDGQTRHGYVHFDLQPRPDTRGWPIVRRSVAPSPIPALLEYLLWLSEEPTNDWVEHAEKTIEALLRVFVYSPLPNADATTEHPVLAAALNHVRMQWAQRMRPVTLTEAASAARVSREHLNRLFRRHYGTGMIKALELVRLSRAETLLTHTDLSVGAVARSCGFDDPLYFSKRFRVAFGASPRAYRAGTSRRSPLGAAGLLSFSGRVTPAA